MTRRTATAFLLLVAALAAIAATALSESSGAAQGGATVTARERPIGTILVDAQGRTLYLFEKDRGRKSACSGACAANWPPLVTKGRPHVAGSARTKLLGTTKRADGRTQVTYGGHPVYRYVGDKKAGSTNGEGVEAFGAEWYAVGTNGKAVEERSSSGY
jgi:predicted lipoprotein with Yx(FWY)xxD motif